MSDTDDIWRKLCQHDDQLLALEAIAERLSRLESPPQAGEPREAEAVTRLTYQVDAQASVCKRLEGEKAERESWANTWHRLVESIATILEVPSAGSALQLGEDIPRAITALRTARDKFECEWTRAHAVLDLQSIPRTTQDGKPRTLANRVSILRAERDSMPTPTPPEPSAVSGHWMSELEAVAFELRSSQYRDDREEIERREKLAQVVDRAASALSMGAGTREGPPFVPPTYGSSLCLGDVQRVQGAALPVIRECGEPEPATTVVDEILRQAEILSGRALVLLSISQPEGQGVGK